MEEIILSTKTYDNMADTIMSFEGENAFLSNFHMLKTPIKWLEVFYRTTEHFYQAMKTLEEDERRWIAGLQHAWQAKRAGSKRGFDGRKITFRPDFDVKRTTIMYVANTLKYNGNPQLLFKLAATHPKQLIEGNHWCDNYWGNCHCHKCMHIPGRNNLGLILMYIRTQFMMVG